MTEAERLALEEKEREEAEEREREREQELKEAEEEKENYETQLEQHEYQFQLNDAKIKRLEDAETALEGAKEELEDMSWKLLIYGEAADTYGEWSGNKHVEICEAMANDVPSEYDSFIGELDDAMDIISEEIKRLKAANLELRNIMDRLNKWIDSLLDKIRSLRN